MKKSRRTNKARDKRDSISLILPLRLVLDFFFEKREKEDRFMTNKVFFIVAAGLIAVANPAFSNILAVPSEFRGRMLTGAGTGLPAVMNVRIVVDSFTTQNEVDRLRDFMNKNESKGFFSAFNQIKKGFLQFPGDMGLNISFHSAFETPTDKGMKIILAGESQALPAGFSPSADAWKVLAPGKNRSGLFLFLVAELDLDKNFKGEGKVYEEARITFTPEGGIKLDSYVKTPKMIVNIEKAK
jgi:hypothetical protein